MQLQHVRMMERDREQRNLSITHVIIRANGKSFERISMDYRAFRKPKVCSKVTAGLGQAVPKFQLMTPLNISSPVLRV